MGRNCAVTPTEIKGGRGEDPLKKKRKDPVGGKNVESWRRRGGTLEKRGKGGTLGGGWEAKKKASKVIKKKGDSLSRWKKSGASRHSRGSTEREV